MSPSPPARACPLTRTMTGTGLSTMVREDLRHAVGRGRATLGQVGARAEHRPGPGQHDGAHVRGPSVASRNACSSCSSRRAESALRLAGESSVRVRIAVAVLHADQRVRHGCAV